MLGTKHALERSEGWRGFIRAFQMDDGKVLVVEHVLCNSPSLIVVTYESREKYIENLLELYWAIDPDYIISIDDEFKKELEQRGAFDDE